MHHPRRRGGTVGDAGRGHGALFSEVDISIEMRHAGSSPDSRARRFFTMSRHADTPRHLLFELNADGSDYVVLADADDDGFQEHWDILRGVLEDATKRLTRAEILAEWPEDYPKPSTTTQWRWLQSRRDRETGAGRRHRAQGRPIPLLAPRRRVRWRENPLYELFEIQRRDKPFLPKF